MELSDQDVETVIRRVVLAKRQDRVNDIEAALEASAGEIDRHLAGSRIGPRSEDKQVLVEDYPLLPVRRRFWEHTLRAVDRAGMAGQLRTQLQIVYEAIRRTADRPLGTVVSANFLFEELETNLLNSGMLLRELHETIVKLRDGTPGGDLKSRLCSLVFLIRKLPREAGADIGVRATAEALADLLVEDLAGDGAALRGRLPALLDELVETGTLMKLEDEYSLQTRESSEWEAEFRNRQSRLANDPAGMSSRRSQLLGAAGAGGREVRAAAAREAARSPGSSRCTSGPSPRPKAASTSRCGYGTAGEPTRAASSPTRAPPGQTAPSFTYSCPGPRADELARRISESSAARETLEYKGVPAGEEGTEARQGMETRRVQAENAQKALVAEIINGAKVFQGGGNERLELSLPEKTTEAAYASLDRLFHRFGDADDHRWPNVIERARRGAEHPLEALEYSGKTEEHPVCSAVMETVGSGRKGKEVRSHLSGPPFGWPRDAIDAALISLLEAGHLRASANGVALKPRGLDQGKVASADFRIESATIDTRQRLRLRSLFQTAEVDCKPNEESEAAGRLLRKLEELARNAGGDAPLPERPGTRHLSELQSLAGNEQLLALLERHDTLSANLEDWTRAGRLAETRLPAFQRLQTLARHADGLDAAREARPQIEAIVADRRLLDPSDPVPGLAGNLTNALRTALAESRKRYDGTYEEEQKRLEESESWGRIEPKDREGIFQRLGISRASTGATGSEQEVLESLERISLDGWRTRTAALPHLFAQARAEADKLVEPEIRHVKLESRTLRTAEEVDAWVRKTEQDLLRQVEQGPIVIG